MVVISPCDAIEAKKATIAAAKTNSPTYIRLAREKTPIITSEETPFEIGKAEVFYEPKGKVEVGIIATGALVYKAIMVAKTLDGKGIGAKILNLSTIKPLDEKAILDLAKEAGAIVTVEEHQIAGGMGSAVAEFLAQTNPVPIEFIGVADQFGQSGLPSELLQFYGMDEEHIQAAVYNVVKKKSD